MIFIYFYFDVFVEYIIFSFFFPFFLGGLPLNGAYDSFVDYSNNDVVYCHWIVINK